MIVRKTLILIVNLEPKDNVNIERDNNLYDAFISQKYVPRSYLPRQVDT